MLHIVNVWTDFQTEFRYHPHYLAVEFIRQGHQNAFLTTDQVPSIWRTFLKRKDEFKAGVSKYEGSDVYRIRCINLLSKPIPIGLWSIVKALRTSKADVVHILGIGNPFCFVVMFLAIMIRGKKCLIVANDHSNPRSESMSLVGRLYYAINKFIFQCFFRRRIKAVYVPNLATQQLICQKYKLDSQQVQIIPLGYDDSVFRYRPQEKNSFDKLVVGFAGKINPQKRVDMLIRAVAAPSVKDHIRLVVAGLVGEGSPYCDSLQQLAMELGIDVEFRPLLPADQLASFYNYVDVAAFPGSISITTIEATGCGTPIVLYNSIPGLEDRVENGRGFLFQEESELLERLEYFVQRKRLNNIDHLAVEQNTKKFSWHEISKRYLAEYQRLSSSS